MTAEQKPSIGRIVIFDNPEHYQNPVPAIVTQVRDGDAVVVTAFPPGIAPQAHGVIVPKHDGSGDQGFSWQWPERI
jgi:hypothetical protein